MKKIAKLLGLDESASEDAILAAIGDRQGKVAASVGLKADALHDDIVKAIEAVVGDRGKLAVAAGLKADASTEEVVAAMEKAGDGMVPASSFQQLQTDFNKLKDSVETEKVETVVAAAIEAGKVTPANRDWAMKHAKSDLKGFQEFVANAPVIAASQFGDRELPGSADEDPNAIAASAQLYQDEQAKLGRTVSMSAAVMHVQSQKKK
jgi:phage I-like protein